MAEGIDDYEGVAVGAATRAALLVAFLYGCCVSYCHNLCGTRETVFEPSSKTSLHSRHPSHHYPCTHTNTHGSTATVPDRLSLLTTSSHTQKAFSDATGGSLLSGRTICNGSTRPCLRRSAFAFRLLVPALGDLIALATSNPSNIHNCCCMNFNCIVMVRLQCGLLRH